MSRNCGRDGLHLQELLALVVRGRHLHGRGVEAVEGTGEIVARARHHRAGAGDDAQRRARTRRPTSRRRTPTEPVDVAARHRATARAPRRAATRAGDPSAIARPLMLVADIAGRVLCAAPKREAQPYRPDRKRAHVSRPRAEPRDDDRFARRRRDSSWRVDCGRNGARLLRSSSNSLERRPGVRRLRLLSFRSTLSTLERRLGCIKTFVPRAPSPHPLLLTRNARERPARPC